MASGYDGGLPITGVGAITLREGITINSLTVALIGAGLLLGGIVLMTFFRHKPIVATAGAERSTSTLSRWRHRGSRRR